MGLEGGGRISPLGLVVARFAATVSGDLEERSSKLGILLSSRVFFFEGFFDVTSVEGVDCKDLEVLSFFFDQLDGLAVEALLFAKRRDIGTFPLGGRHQ
jgi:hypothetical protein